MSDFLDRVARRVGGSGSVARLRPRARYERAEQTVWVQSAVESAPVAAPVVPEARAVAPQAAGPDLRGAPAPITRAEPPRARAVAAPAVAEDLPAVPPPPVSASPTVVAPLPPRPARRAERTRPEPELGRPVPPDVEALPPVRRRPPPDERAAASAAPPDPGALLARHVVPALVEAGLLPDPEVTLVRGTAPVPRPAPGARPVVRVAEVAPATRAGGDVHVHIAHVEVVHPAPRAPAPARARAARGPVVDHDAYLAGRRGERS